MSHKKPRVNEIEKIIGVDMRQRVYDYPKWLRRRLRALVRKAFWIHRDSAGKVASDAFEEKFGFSAWYRIKP